MSFKNRVTKVLYFSLGENLKRFYRNYVFHQTLWNFNNGTEERGLLTLKTKRKLSLLWQPKSRDNMSRGNIRSSYFNYNFILKCKLVIFLFLGHVKKQRWRTLPLKGSLISLAFLTAFEARLCTYMINGRSVSIIPTTNRKRLHIYLPTSVQCSANPSYY